jgi:hypothetical protein
MAFWDSVSGFLGDVNDTVSSLADTYNQLGQAGIVDIGPSGGGSSGGSGGFGGTNYGAGYSFPPPPGFGGSSTLVAPGAPAAPPSMPAETPAFIWIAGAVALVWLAKK